MYNRGYSDKSLIEMILANDSKPRKAALQFIIDEYYIGIKSYIRQNSGTEQDASDVFQDSLVILYENLIANKFGGKSSISTYLYSISRNIWLKKLKKRLPVVGIEELREKELGIPEETGAQFSDDGRQLIYQILENLSAGCRDILIGFYFENKSMLELMELNNMGSEQSTKNKKMKCLKKLVTLFKTKGLKPEHFFDE